MTTIPEREAGERLRDWRRNRRMSQLELASEVGVSTRHLSFVETGRSRPSPDLILRLAEHLDVPLGERNAMLLAGGYAPAYPDHDWDDSALASVRDVAEQILHGHGPNPAVLVDRHWRLVVANPAVDLLTADADPKLLTSPINVLRLSLHPAGMAPRIRNLPEWRAHLLDRLHRQAQATRDPVLRDLERELRELPGGLGSSGDAAGIVVPLRFDHDGQELSLISTTTVFGTPLDVTVAGLAIEAFYPADETTATALREFSGR